MHFIYEFCRCQWILHIIIGVFALFRMKARKTEVNPDSTFTPLPATITPVGLELDPDTPAEQIITSSDSK